MILIPLRHLLSAIWPQMPLKNIVVNSYIHRENHSNGEVQVTTRGSRNRIHEK